MTQNSAVLFCNFHSYQSWAEINPNCKILSRLQQQFSVNMGMQRTGDIPLDPLMFFALYLQDQFIVSRLFTHRKAATLCSWYNLNLGAKIQGTESSRNSSVSLNREPGLLSQV